MEVGVESGRISCHLLLVEDMLKKWRTLWYMDGIKENIEQKIGVYSTDSACNILYTCRNWTMRVRPWEYALDTYSPSTGYFTSGSSLMSSKTSYNGKSYKLYMLSGRTPYIEPPSIQSQWRYEKHRKLIWAETRPRKGQVGCALFHA